MIKKVIPAINIQPVSRMVGGLRLKDLVKSSSHDKPRIPIITPVFNGEKILEEISVLSSGALSFGDPFSQPVLNYRQFF
jgi:hypothetical protein